jgi:hypothetical protein
LVIGYWASKGRWSEFPDSDEKPFRAGFFCVW